MGHHTSHPEWVLTLVLQIDQERPGFCGAFLRASHERRHVIAAYLSTNSRPENRAEIAEFLVSARHRAILARAYHVVPQGLRGALRRAGPLVHEERFYSVLYKLMSNPRHGQIAKCVNRLGSIDLLKLRVLNILPESICKANVVECVGSVQQACDLIASMKLLVGAGVNEDELAYAISNVRDEDGLAKALRKALLTCHAPRHPIEASQNYRPISTPRALHEVATRFRNCARNYTIDILDDQAGHAFAEVRCGREGAVVHLRRRGREWRLEGIFGPRNMRPSPTLREQVVADLADQGVFTPEQGRRKSEWDPLRRAAAAPMFDFDF